METTPQSGSFCIKFHSPTQNTEWREPSGRLRCVKTKHPKVTNFQCLLFVFHPSQNLHNLHLNHLDLSKSCLILPDPPKWKGKLLKLWFPRKVSPVRCVDFKIPCWFSGVYIFWCNYMEWACGQKLVTKVLAASSLLVLVLVRFVSVGITLHLFA